MTSSQDLDPNAAFAGLPLDVQQRLAELQRQSDALPRPTSLDAATLQGIADENLGFAISWYVGHRMRTSGLAREVALRQETSATRDVYLTLLLEGEVLNGGFNQYLWNVPAELVAETAAALERVGASGALEVFQAAMRRGDVEADMRASGKALGTIQAFSESYEHSQLDPFDERFEEQVDDLNAKRIAFVRAHDTAFATPGR